ncbi:MAG: tyrosine-type recombinase/integrase [Christensenellales bacterium]|jgi:integrase/recombinase XerC
MADYRSSLNKTQIEKLRNIINTLPEFCYEFFRGVEPNTSVLTRTAYAYDLRLFFKFLSERVAYFKNMPAEDIALKDMERITSTHIEMFAEYLSYYADDEQEYENHDRGKKRKLSSIRSFLNYFYKKGKLPSNVAALVDLPKIHDKPIIRLEADEAARLIDVAESGEDLSDKQKKYHRLTARRDKALITLFLGTGIRVSELVGISLDDVDFSANSLRVTRKGGNQTILYFGEETRAALLEYIEERRDIVALEGHENALFLSLQKRRISVRAVQDLVKKYASHAAPLKNISPHKLRSTYGTMLYREVGDIYLVADVLDHKDVNTTRRHYAAISEDSRKRAANAFKIRDDD